MKILFTTLNSKFIHSNLAIKYLSKCINNNDIYTKEFTINEDIEDIYSDIICKGYNIIAFSCYIWNIEKTLKIVDNIKKSNPNIMIILGGPEVSYNIKNFMEKNSFVDLVIAGEGEEALLKFNNIINEFNENNKEFDYENFVEYSYEKLLKIKNIFFRFKNKIINESSEEDLLKAMQIQDLTIVPYAYDSIEKEDIKDKIVYYETSRGCTFKCSYCLSATSKGIRYFEEEKVYKELKKLVELDAKQIKFVDRTFNADSKRAKKLVEYLKDIDNGEINFHFEITAHLLQDEFLEIIKSARVGLFQFEIGVQSTNSKTLLSVSRSNMFEKLSDNVNKIKSFKNTHLHLDLIAGLPFENYERFIQSFNDVFNLRPDALQLGFLKLLKGSPIYSEIEKYEYVYRDYPPYEILKNKFITTEEILKLKNIEKMVDIYYNKNRYTNSINYLLEFYDVDGFKMFEKLYDIVKTNNIELSKKNDEFRAMYLIVDNKFEEFEKNFFVELLRFDYLLMGRNPNIPEFIMPKTYSTKEDIFDIIKNEEILFDLGFENISPKEAFKKIFWSNFEYDILEYQKNKKIIRRDNVVLINYSYNRRGDEKFKATKVFI